MRTGRFTPASFPTQAGRETRRYGPARAATNADTSRTCAALRLLRNAGIPPPPFSTCALTAAKDGRSESRFGPITPVALAAFIVWHDPQPALLKTPAPAATFAAAGTGVVTAAGGGFALASSRYSQSALVYQTPISTVKSRPPASGRTGRGKRCRRTIVIFDA